MTEKRFTFADGFNIVAIKDNDKIMNSKQVCNQLNEFYEENEQLKQAYAQLRHRHSLLHDECMDTECDRDSYCKDIASLEKENEQLNNENKSFKAEIEQLKKCYNNVLDEMDTLAEVNDKTYKENKELKQSNKDAWNLIQFIYEEIKEEGSMDWERIQDLVEF